MENELMSLPMVALRGLAVLPEQVTHFDVSREKSVQAITQAMKKDQKIFLVMQKEVEVEEPKESDLYRIGCIATVKQIVKLPGNMKRVLVSGEQRAGLSWIESEEPYFQVAVKILPDFCKPEDRELLENPINEEGMVRGLRELFRDYMSKNPKLAKELAMMIEEIKSLRVMVDTIAANLPMDYEDTQKVLEEQDILQRYEDISLRVVNEMRVLSVKEELQKKVKERVDKNQREYILREEMKLIREELGEDTLQTDAEEFEQAVKDLDASCEVKEKLAKEIKRFKFQTILCLLNCLSCCSDQADIMFFEKPPLFQFHSKIQRCLSSQSRQDTVWLFFHNKLFNNFYRQWLYVYFISNILVRHNSRRI